MTNPERDDLLAAFLTGIGGLERTVGELTGRVDNIEAAVEEVRRNAKGASNWGKVASGVAALAPVVTAIVKAAGWL